MIQLQVVMGVKRRKGNADTDKEQHQPANTIIYFSYANRTIDFNSNRFKNKKFNAQIEIRGFGFKGFNITD